MTGSSSRTIVRLVPRRFVRCLLFLSCCGCLCYRCCCGDFYGNGNGNSAVGFDGFMDSSMLSTTRSGSFATAFVIPRKHKSSNTKGNRPTGRDPFFCSSLLEGTEKEHEHEHENENETTRDDDDDDDKYDAFGETTVRVHRLASVNRVYCISDLHVDNSDNMRWLESLCSRRIGSSKTGGNEGVVDDHNSSNSSNSNKSNNNNNNNNNTNIPRTTPRETDLIIVAGDISHDLGRIKTSLSLLRGTGASVVFVPGNHEAWLSREESESSGSYTSIGKLRDVRSLCKELGVYTTGSCVCVVDGGGPSDDDDDEPKDEPKDATTTTTTNEELWILPLDSWYDGSLSFVDLSECCGCSGGAAADCEGVLAAAPKAPATPASPPRCDLVSDFGRWGWVDFRKCVWPTVSFENGSNTSNRNRTGDTRSASLAKDFGEGEQQQQQQQQQLQSRPSLLRKIPLGIVEYYLKQNEPVLDAFRNAVGIYHNNNNNNNNNNNGSTPNTATAKKSIRIVTVSHFLPNVQSLPDWKDLTATTFDLESWLDHGAGGVSAKFALVAGSAKIDDQIRSLVPPPACECVAETKAARPSSSWSRVHVFGHSHRPKDFVYEGIRYVHNPLGKPREREMRMIDPNADLKLLWEKKTTTTTTEPTSVADGNAERTTARAPLPPGHGGGNGSSSNLGEDDTIIRYWEERGGGLEMLRKRMAKTRRGRRKNPESE